MKRTRRATGELIVSSSGIRFLYLKYNDDNCQRLRRSSLDGYCLIGGIYLHRQLTRSLPGLHR